MLFRATLFIYRCANSNSKRVVNGRARCFANYKCLSTTSVDDGQTLRFEMLNSTRAKLINAYDASVGYIAHLIAERAALCTQLNAETSDANNSMDTNKSELFKRLNFLDTVHAHAARLERCERDAAELHDALGQCEDEAKGGDDGDAELRSMMESDLARLANELDEHKIAFVDLLVPDESEDKEDAVLELSAAVGGQESRLFCADMFYMYQTWAACMGWSFAPSVVMSEKHDGLGELMRQAIVEVSGTDVYKYLKFESGVHRVQRVPATEAKGRIHTSTVGVVVTPKPAVLDFELNLKELKIETKTSSGPGGQHVNKTESAVRLTHLPTGTVVYVDEERQQAQNRARAFRYMQQKLYQRAYEEQLERRQVNRKLQIGSAGRSERIRTYNFIQDRISDHRLGENVTGMVRFLAGDAHSPLTNVVESLRREHKIEMLHEVLEKFAARPRPTN